MEARERTGAGQHVDISQMETGAYLIGPAVLDYLANEREAQPVGNADPFGQVVPNNCYVTADRRWVAVSCRDDDDWNRLAAVIGAPDALARADADPVVAQWASTVDAEAAQELLQSAGIPAGLVQDAGDLMVDPQLIARGLWQRCDHAVFGERPFDRYPALWSTMSLEPYLPPPSYVGEHNFEVFQELANMDVGEVAEGMGDGLFS